MSSTPAPLQTPLHEWHRARGARLVEFGGWSMPVQYTSIVEEHNAVRNRAGLFDISHMGRLEFEGEGELDWLEHATTNHVARLADGQIQYSLMLNDDGGAIDDILVYRRGPGFLVVCNASNRAQVVARFESERERARIAADAAMDDQTTRTAMLAIQGPEALAILGPLFDRPLAPLRYYHHTSGKLLGRIAGLVSRTGYTGEDGFEVIVAAPAALEIWNALLESGRERGILPCGLGARDTLRLEAAMPLYGHELSDRLGPFSSGVGWAVKLDKGDFAGRAAAAADRASPRRRRIGLQLEGRRIARQGAPVLDGDRAVGEVTSGTFAPTLQASVAMALVEPGAEKAAALQVEIRDRREPARTVKLPFYRREKPPAAAS